MTTKVIPPASDRRDTQTPKTSGTNKYTATAVRFQALPPLSPEEYAALENSILDHGVLVPILVDEHGVVIDGHHRQKIAKHHDLPCPREVKSGFTDTEKRTMALETNIARRHLTREQKRALVAESITADPQLSDRQHGHRTGVDHKTATKVRDDLEERGEIPHVSERTDSLGRQQPASKPSRPQPEPDSGSVKYCPDCGSHIGYGLDGVRRCWPCFRRSQPAPEHRDRKPLAPERKPRRGPITDDARRLSLDLGRINKRLNKLLDDDRFSRNSDVIGNMIRPDVDHGLDVLHRLEIGINKADRGDDVIQDVTQYAKTLMAAFTQTFAPHRLKQFSAEDRQAFLLAMKETLQQLEELENPR